MRPVSSVAGPRFNFPLARDKSSLEHIICDDAVVLTLQHSTQWDAFAHVGARFDLEGDGVPVYCYYNGFRAGFDIVGPSDNEYLGRSCCGAAGSGSFAHRLGIENFAQKAIQSRGVLVDLFKHYGGGRQRIGLRELLVVLDKDEISLRPGDILLLHTGLGQLIMAGGKDLGYANRLQNYGCVLDGKDRDLLDWIGSSDISAICSDNYAIEQFPPLNPEEGVLELHHHCLFKLGLPLGELWYLTEFADWMAKHKRSYCLLTAPPLRLPGAVGSPLTPVATV